MEKREQLSKIIMTAIMTLWFSMEILFNSKLEYIFIWTNDDANDFVAKLVFILLLIEIVFFQKYTARELVIVATLAIPVIFGTINSNNNMMISTIMFIVASKYIDFDRMIHIAYVILVVMVAFVLYLYFSGWIDEVTVYRGLLLRHSWGFNHPNWLGIRIFQIAVMQFYIHRKKIRWWNYATIIIALIFVKKVPNCKTAFYALLIFLIMLFIYSVISKFENGSIFFARGMIITSVLSNAISVVLSLINVQQHSLLRAFDNAMSNRFSWCHRTIDHYGLSILGQNIELMGRKLGVNVHLFYIDTAYVAILIRYGLIVYIFFSVLYIVSMWFVLKAQNYILLIIMTMYAIYGIMENSFCSMTQNIFLLSLAFPIYSITITSEEDSIKSKVAYRFV